jgi:hypothetical protein
MKDLKISKELLSEVLNLNITYIERCNNSIVYKVSVYDREEEVNIYEFVFKCKEWALTKGYFIYSTNELSFIKTFSLETIETFSNGKDTEIECILKACEWVLKEINENR